MDTGGSWSRSQAVRKCSIINPLKWHNNAEIFINIINMPLLYYTVKYLFHLSPVLVAQGALLARPEYLPLLALWNCTLSFPSFLA